MIACHWGVSNRINAVLYCLISGDSEFYWPINSHCCLAPESIFGEELRDRLQFSNEDRGSHSLWAVPSNYTIDKIYDSALFLYENFLPDFKPEYYEYSVHGRVMGYGKQIHDIEFIYQANRFVKKQAFVLIDNNREYFYNNLCFDIKNPLSKELTEDLSRWDIDDQLNFCKDLKTIWNAKNCLSNNWKSTITDMRSFLKKDTYITLGDWFEKYDENLAISCEHKKIWLG